MSAFNMLNRVPYNVTVPEYQPERRSPIFPQITRKYPCIENIANLGLENARARSRLSWKIQQPDPTLVFTGVKLVLPLRMQSFTVTDHVALDMRVTSKRPSANIALAETPMMAFGQTSLSLNGRIFSEVNSYRRMLDACYRGSSPAAYGDNHSLKPVVIRNMDNDNSRQVTVVRNEETDEVVTTDGGQALVIDQIFLAGKTLDSAFSLLENNGPFLERARKFQDNLSEDGTTWEDDVTSYLEVGPFQSRARKGNTAVPYIRDMHLMLNFIGGESRFDRDIGSELSDAAQLPLRALPARLFEFGTPSNLRHPGEQITTGLGWIGYMMCTWREKPYLEVTYTKYIEAMKPSYALRCFDRQYEKSNEFELTPSPLGSDTKLARVTSRILSMPTLIYVYAELSDVQKGAFANGGVRRSCRLNNLHCRINQRPNVVFNPSQEDCFEMFQRHTNSSLEYASWLKSPIYVFSPVDLGQPDMFANDARRTIFEWDAEVTMTPLQGQEETDLLKNTMAIAVGYKGSAALAPTFQGGLDPVYCRWNRRKHANLNGRVKAYALEFRQPLVAEPRDCVLTYDYAPDGVKTWTQFVEDKQFIVKWAKDGGGNKPGITEDARLGRCGTAYMGARGLLWAAIKIDADGDPIGTVRDGAFFYVPFTHDFLAYDTSDRHARVNSWSRVLEYKEGDPDDKGHLTYTATVAVGGDFKWWRGAPRGAEKQIMNPVIGGQTLATGDTSWNEASPGPLAYYCDKGGMRNTPTGTAAWNYPGPLDVGEAPYIAIKQQTDSYRWAAFALSDEMVNGTGDFGNFCKLMATTDPSKLPGDGTGVADALLVAGEAGFNMAEVQGHGAFTLGCDWEVERGVRYRKTNETVNMSQVAVHSWGWDLDVETLPANDQLLQYKRQYQLKALYEFGNAQYQFSADAMPTKVLPNLVPVAPSAGIPIIQ